MNTRVSTIALVVVLCSAFTTVNRVKAQEVIDPAQDQSDHSGIFGEAKTSSPSAISSDPAKWRADRVAQLRQARALYRSQQRVARLEHNLWIGHQPLRPNWNAVPTMSSRYNYSRTIYVPVYVGPRQR